MAVAASLALLFACWWGPVLALASVLNAKSRRPVFWGWLILAMLVHAAYAAATRLTPGLVLDTVWSGHLAGLVVCAAVIALLLRRHRRLMPNELGLALRQERGSLAFSLGGVIVLVGLGLVASALSPVPPEPMSAMAFHATLPGLAEEPLYRGLLLALLTAAMGKRPAALFWGAVMANLIFALDHGIFWDEGGIGFNWLAIAVTGVAGAVLTALRLKSGSLLPGVIGHNLMGLAARFV